MEHIYNDIDFMNIIKPILNNNYFMKTQSTIHHGKMKLDHSIRIAYYSYNIARKYNLDYVSVARGGMLHDFYYSNTCGKSWSKESIKLTFTHYNTALINATNSFSLNDMEKDIIVKHMFPIVLTIPKYKESILVAIVDKVLGTMELLSKFKILVNFNMLAKIIPTYIIISNTLR